MIAFDTLSDKKKNKRIFEGLPLLEVGGGEDPFSRQLETERERPAARIIIGQNPNPTSVVVENITADVERVDG